MGELTHFNEQGRARMVDVTEKAVTHRRAVAAGEIRVSPETMAHIKNGTMKRVMCWRWPRWRGFRPPSATGS